MCLTLNNGRGYLDHSQTKNGAKRLLFRADSEQFQLHSIANFKRGKILHSNWSFNKILPFFLALAISNISKVWRTSDLCGQLVQLLHWSSYTPLDWFLPILSNLLFTSNRPMVPLEQYAERIPYYMGYLPRGALISMNMYHLELTPEGSMSLGGITK